jgi:uncharacterized protein (DUF305 family)
MTTAHSRFRIPHCALKGVLLLGLAGAAQAQAQVPIIQPGAPGEDVRELSAEEAVEITDSSYSPADVQFVKDMIPHHHQALEMAELVSARTNNPELVDVAGRINASQQDEIEFMQQWLRERGQEVPDPADHGHMHTSHTMAGMATPEQMAELAAASATDFDRLFLQLMMTHHEGAVTMVKELLEQPGSAFDPILFDFTSDVTNDQTAEIERMHKLLLAARRPLGRTARCRPGDMEPGTGGDAGQATRFLQPGQPNRGSAGGPAGRRQRGRNRGKPTGGRTSRGRRRFSERGR